MTRYSYKTTRLGRQINGKRTFSKASTSPFRLPSYALDNALLAALKEGHHEFLRYAIRHTRSISDSEALVRKFYRDALGSSALKDGEGLKNELITALRRMLSGYRRGPGATGAQEQQRPDVDEPLPMFLDEVERTVTGCLYRILPTLPSDSSWLIWQADLLGQPSGRLAKKLGIDIDNLALRLARARRTMRGVLERYCVTCPSHGFLNCTCEQPLKPGPESVLAPTLAATS